MDCKNIFQKIKKIIFLFIIIIGAIIIYLREESSKYSVCYRTQTEWDIYDSICFKAKNLLSQKRYIKGWLSSEIIDLEYPLSFHDDVEIYLPSLKKELKKHFKIDDIKVDELLKSISYQYHSHYFTKEADFPNVKRFEVYFLYQYRKYKVSLYIANNKEEWGRIEQYE